MTNVQPKPIEDPWQSFANGLAKGERLVEVNGIIKVLHKDVINKMPWGPKHIVLNTQDIAKRIIRDPRFISSPESMSHARRKIEQIYNAKVDSLDKFLSTKIGKIFGSIYTFFANISVEKIKDEKTQVLKPYDQAIEDYQIKAELNELEKPEEALKINEDPSKWTHKERGEAKNRLYSLLDLKYRFSYDFHHEGYRGPLHARLSALKNGALEAFKAGDEAGDLECTFRAAELLERGSTDEAIVFYEKASKKGHLLATLALGRVYIFKKDIKTAIEYYTQAAEKGDKSAAKELYYIYTTAEGFKSPQLAAKYIDPELKDSNRKIKELLEKNSPGILNKLKINEDSNMWSPGERGDAQMELYNQLKKQIESKKEYYRHRVVEDIDARKEMDSYRYMARGSYWEGETKGDKYCKQKSSDYEKSFRYL